jgi:hypothetical protein
MDTLIFNAREILIISFANLAKIFKEVLTPFKEVLDNLTLKLWKDRQIWYVKLPPN